MKQKYVFGAFVTMFALVGAAILVHQASPTLAKSENASQAQNTKGNAVKNTEKSETPRINIKQEAMQYEKAQRASMAEPEETQTPGKSNAMIHEEKAKNVNDLLQSIVIENEEENEKVKKDLEDVAQETEETSEKVAEAITEVESQNKFKTFLVGADYKNLGQLRSSLAHNQNQIRKMTRTLEQAQTDEAKQLIEKSIADLMAERQRVYDVIHEGESTFSILGWFSRFFTGYSVTPEEEDQQAENSLTDEVQNAIDKSRK